MCKCDVFNSKIVMYYKKPTFLFSKIKTGDKINKIVKQKTPTK